LVIEHNPLTRGIMRAILSAKFEVIKFVDGAAEACSFLALEQADWIVADASSVEDFAQLFDATDIPIVLVEGADVVPDDAREHAHVVLAKPLTKSMLLSVFAGQSSPVQVAA
jgi:CheY-like chemotaxis protein